MRILDLFCGLGGWSEPFMKNGHEVTGYDIANFSDKYPGKFVQCDLMEFSDFPHDVKLIMASPPCTDFSKASFPASWKSVQKYPPNIDMAVRLFNRAREIINDINPQYWIIENVRGAQKYVGKADYHIGSRYFWSNIPYFYTGDFQDIYGKWKLSPSPDRPAIRSKIPFSISDSLRRYLVEVIP